MATHNYTRQGLTTGSVITEQAVDAWDEALVGLYGEGNQTVALLKALFHQIDTRSWVATAWDSNDKPTHIDIKDGAAVVATLDMTWNGDGKLTQCVAVAGGKTVTYTVTWTGEKFSGITKAVTP